MVEVSPGFEDSQRHYFTANSLHRSVMKDSFSYRQWKHGSHWLKPQELMTHKSSRKGVVWFQFWIDPGAQRITLRFSLSPLCCSVPFCPIVDSLLSFGGSREDMAQMTLTYVSQFGKPRGKGKTSPSLRQYIRVDKSQERALMGPAWITAWTSWTSHYIQGDRVPLQAAYFKGTGYCEFEFQPYQNHMEQVMRKE